MVFTASNRPFCIWKTPVHCGALSGAESTNPPCPCQIEVLLPRTSAPILSTTVGCSSSVGCEQPSLWTVSYGLVEVAFLPGLCCTRTIGVLPFLVSAESPQVRQQLLACKNWTMCVWTVQNTDHLVADWERKCSESRRRTRADGFPEAGLAGKPRQFQLCVVYRVIP